MVLSPHSSQQNTKSRHSGSNSSSHFTSTPIRKCCGAVSAFCFRRWQVVLFCPVSSLIITNVSFISMYSKLAYKCSSAGLRWPQINERGKFIFVFDIRWKMAIPPKLGQELFKPYCRLEGKANVAQAYIPYFRCRVVPRYFPLKGGVSPGSLSAHTVYGAHSDSAEGASLWPRWMKL